MTDRVEIIAQIRFALEQLSERNGQHEWEHLCRHLARERICSNILPATGPVQAGGDQGRDFETFRTFLSQSAIAHQSFIGLVSDRPLAFACSLEQGAVAKIRHDIDTIMASGTPIDGIYFFSSRGIPVARRHDVQAWARATYDVTVEILDALAVAELLADRDIFWIAERFLQLPTALLPVSSDQENALDWYGQVQQKWQRETRAAQTYADFNEIRSAARSALGPFAFADDGRPLNRHQRPELPFWIDRLDQIAETAAITTLRRRARYEATVLRLRGLGSLIGQEINLQHYFADIPTLEDPGDLRDAQALISYVWPAMHQRLVDIPETTIVQWFQTLDARIQTCLAEAEQSNKINTQCALLETRGFMELNRTVMQGTPDFTPTLTLWQELAQKVRSAPLFPLEDFADRLTKLPEFIPVPPDYDALTSMIDELLAQRFGQFRVAEQCLKRAEVFRKAGNLPQAMNQLHKAKVDWFAEETLYKSLVALRWLSYAYTDQGMLFAAKYYALAGAYVALHTENLTVKPGIANFLERAASCEYAMGAWNGFLAVADAYTTIYPHFAQDIDADLANRESSLYRLIFHLVMVEGASSLFAVAVEPLVLDRCHSLAQHMGIDDVFTDAHDQMMAQWGGDQGTRLRIAMQQQFTCAPWSDGGPERHVAWYAHGVRWNISWENTYELTIVAEEFLAALQILLSDFVGQDLCLTRSTLNITLCFAPGPWEPDGGTAARYNGYETIFQPSNTTRQAIVTLPPYSAQQGGTESFHDVRVGALSVVSTLLAEVSLLPTKRYYEVLEERFAQGLQTKLAIGAPYRTCFREFIRPEVFDTPIRSLYTPPTLLASFTSEVRESIPWIDTDGPGYDHEAALNQIRNRYQQFGQSIQRTLHSLNQESSFQDIVKHFRTCGWKDWHILAAVFHITMNYRLNHSRTLFVSPAAEMEAMRRLTSEPESENALPVPLSEYTETTLWQHIRFYMLAFARAYGLECHQQTPDFEGVEDFIAQRYHFWTDDVEHVDPFAPPALVE